MVALPYSQEALQAIAAAAHRLHASATIYHPGYLRIQVLNGRIGHVGAVNGPWAIDIYNSIAKESDAVALASRPIPAAHAATAEGIARYAVGVMAGLHAYTAYASDREQREADRAERITRNRR